MKEGFRGVFELSGITKRALGIFSIAVFAYLIACSPITHANEEIPIVQIETPISIPTLETYNVNEVTTEFPIAYDWNSADGYLFDTTVARVQETTHLNELGQDELDRRAVFGSQLLCENAPDSPACASFERVLSAMDIGEADVPSFLRHTLVVKDEGVASICHKANACVSDSYVADTNTFSAWILMRESSFIFDSLTVEIFAHELTHMLSGEGVPGDNINYDWKVEVVGGENLSSDNSCVLLTRDGGDICSTITGGVTTTCTPYNYSELVATTSARTYLSTDFESKCADFAFTRENYYCAGGYYDVYDLSLPDLPGLMAKGKVIDMINLPWAQVWHSPELYKQWIKFKLNGQYRNAFNLFQNASRMEDLTPEEALMKMSEANRALYAYSTGFEPAVEASYEIQKPITEVCRDN